MRLPFDGIYTYLRISSFGDNLEFAFFGALTSVGALFCFLEVTMEKDTKKIKFPIGAIFIMAYAILSFCFFIIDNTGNLNFLGIIRSLSYVPIAIILMMKKRGLPILITTSVIALFSLISFDISSIPFLACLALIILISLDDMKIGNLSALRNVFFKGIMISVLLYFVLWIVLYIIKCTNPDIVVINPVSTIMRHILLTVSMLLIGLWIHNPYKKSNKGDISNEFYVALGKHICLLIFTFGIWQMIWVYKTTKFTNCAKGEEERDPTKKLLLYLFIPLYSIYWTYKSAQRIDIIAKDGKISSDLGTVCLILAIFVGIVPPILMQEKINEIIKKNSTSPIIEESVS